MTIDTSTETANRLGRMPTCRVVRPGAEFVGKQALLYAPGISAESVDAQGIHLQVVTIPPGGRAKAHKHDGHETATIFSAANPACGMARGSKNSSLLGPGTLSTSLPVCLICPITSARRRAALRLLPARIPTSRRASCCCPSSIASIHNRYFRFTLLPDLSCPLPPRTIPQAFWAGYGNERPHLIRGQPVIWAENLRRLNALNETTIAAAGTKRISL
jgi:hypothetical protein